MSASHLSDEDPDQPETSGDEDHEQVKQEREYAVTSAGAAVLSHN